MTNPDIPSYEEALARNRDVNLREVLEALGGDELTRRELVQRMGLARSTVYDHLKKALAAKKVAAYCRPRRTRGRPPVYWRRVTAEEVRHARRIARVSGWNDHLEKRYRIDERSIQAWEDNNAA